MESSIERPNTKDIKIVCGEMAYDERENGLEFPPSTVNNVKMLPKHGVPMQEGEITIALGNAKYDRDENGKIINIKYLKQKEQEEEREMA